MSFVLLLPLFIAGAARGDVFTYLDPDGAAVELEAELIGSGDGLHALELPNGQLRLIPQAAVRSRDIAPPPEPLDAQAIGQELLETFGAERLYVHVDSPFVVGLIGSAEIADDRAQARARVLAKNTVRFMECVQSKFVQFARRVHVSAEPLRYPLVVLIFECDADFDAYVPKVTRGAGLSAKSIAGYYDFYSNYLVLRQRECRTFEVPLHEAIHQQVYNRRIFRRLAPIPAWFNEGLATGFEADGERVRRNPRSVSTRYATMALSASSTDWTDIVRNDRAFYGDVLAGEAYGQAWGLHWLLATRYRGEYGKYLRMLAEKQPFEETSPDERVREFEQIVEKSVPELQQEFYRVVRAALSSKRVPWIPAASIPDVPIENYDFFKTRSSFVADLRSSLGPEP